MILKLQFTGLFDVYNGRIWHIYKFLKKGKAISLSLKNDENVHFVE